MLRSTRKAFCLFSWGPNVHNLGRSCRLEDNHVLPAAFAAPLAAPLSKAVSGVAESLLLAENGELFTHGHRGVIARNAPVPALYQVEVRDADVDESHAAFLFRDGRVVVDTGGKQRLFADFAAPKAIACGAEEVLVVSQLEACDQLCGVQLAQDGRAFHREHRLSLLNELLRARGARVQKLRLAKAAGAALLSDGALFTWGVNTHGNVGVPSSTLRRIAQEIYRPKEPFAAAGIAAAAADFALSVNVLAVLTRDGRALFCGFEDVFVLRELRLPDGERPARVCAWESNVGVIAESGALYLRFPFEEDARPARYFADCEIYRIGAEYFDHRRVVDLGATYANPIALTRPV